jgi:hypothetical protein
LTHDAFSDLVLFAVCIGLAIWNLPARREQAGLGIACLVIGLAALLGVIRFSDWDPYHHRALGPHRFAATFASVGAFPVLAYSLAYPESPLSKRLSGAWWLTFVVGGFGMAIWLLGFKLWAQIVPVLSGLWIASSIATGYRDRNPWLGTVGIVFLFASFAVTLSGPAAVRVLGIFTTTQMFHYFLATALCLIAVSNTKQRGTAEGSRSS